MRNKGVINVEKALEEKRKQQTQFYIENGYPSSVFALLIEYFENCKTNRRKEDEEDRTA